MSVKVMSKRCGNGPSALVCKHTEGPEFKSQHNVKKTGKICSAVRGEYGEIPGADWSSAQPQVLEKLSQEKRSECRVLVYGVNIEHTWRRDLIASLERTNKGV